MLKMSFAVYRRPELTREEFLHHWTTDHAALAKKHAKALRMRRYVQHHGEDNEVSKLLTASRQCQPPHDGVCQIWWDSEEDRLAAAATPEGQAAGRELHEDELRFCDMSRATVCFGTEHVVIDGPIPD